MSENFSVYHFFCTDCFIPVTKVIDNISETLCPNCKRTLKPKTDFSDNGR